MAKTLIKNAEIITAKDTDKYYIGILDDTIQVISKELPQGYENAQVIDAEGKKEDVMEDIMKKIDFYLKKRAAGRLQIECIVYSNTYGLLGMTAKAEELLRRLL